jgi:putative CocE/NonD family hydrolase
MRGFGWAISTTLLVMLMAKAAAPDANDVSLEMHLSIPMHDGVRLNGTLFRPAGPIRRAPTVFMLTAYPDDGSHPSGSYFAQHGFNYVYVDVRGRGDSEGIFVPFEHDGADGYDVVEWLAKQPWSDGHVAMFGGSYAGGDQWQVAATHPPHLSAIAPVASVRLGIDFPMARNIASPYAIQWLSYTSGHTLYAALFQDPLWRSMFRQFYRDGRPFSQLDVAAGNPNPAFHTWIGHPDYDAYWKSVEPQKDAVSRIAMPMLVVTGANDGDQLGTMSFYNDHLTPSGPAKDYFMVIGPWDHAGTRDPQPDIDGEHYGPASLLDLRRLHLEFYRYAMLNGPKPRFFQKNVAYYVSGPGAECWKYADSVAEATTQTQTLFLNAAGGAASLYSSGVLQPSERGAVGGEWLSDPADLSHADTADLPPGDDLEGDGLVFHTAPFAQDTEITGLVKLRLWLAIAGPDADMDFRLYLITPDGKEHLLDKAGLRARYRLSPEHAMFVKPGAVEAYDLPGRQWFSLRAPKGSRLRLIVESINTPGSQKNYNAAKPISDETLADAHAEKIRLVQDAAHPSTIALPLGDIDGSCSSSATW